MEVVRGQDGLTRWSYQTVLPDGPNQLTNFRTSFHVLEGCFLFYNIISCFRISFLVLEHLFLLYNVLFCFGTPWQLLKKYWNIVEKLWKKNVSLQKMRVARVWCVTSLKVPPRTHIAHIFEKSFCMHTHTCNRKSHTCVRARTFATHALLFGIGLKYLKI